MRVEKTTIIDASREEIWELIADPCLYPRFMHGVTGLKRKDDGPEQGVGARYSIHLHVGSADVGGLVEIVEFDEPADLAWTSVTGIDQRLRWRLRETDDSRTRVTLRLAYDAPGGVLGAISEQVSKPMVASNLEQTLQNLKAEIEGGPDEVSEGMSIPGRVAYQLGSVKVLVDAGVVRPMRPDRLLKFVQTLMRWGRSPAAGAIALADRFPNETMVVDELGALTFSDVHTRSNALAHSLSDLGVVEGDGVGIMCRNHRGFIESTFAVSKLGGSSLYLNTAFAGPQLAEVVDRERPKAIIYDEEFAGLLAEAGKRRKRVVAWHDSERCDDPTIDDLIGQGDPEDVVPPSQEGRAVILTSGTTGSPKGASRANPQSLDPAVSLLATIPLKARQTAYIAAPLFHSWGFAHFTLGLILGSTYVLRRKFDPEQCLADIARYRCDSLVVVPVMMQRILVRRHALQPLRLDRGGLGVDRHPGRHARRPRHRRQAAARDRREAL